MQYVGRPPQVDMVRAMAPLPRLQLIASMGLGKSGAAILAASMAEAATGRWPGMVIAAPTQVALGWARELPRWRPDLRVAVLTGDIAERRRALHAGADVYVLNYEALPWLHEEGPRNWSTLGQIMVCDEATRIKKCRCSMQTSSTGLRYLRRDGGIRTKALAEHAGDFGRWINMTATPIPNGLHDAWGQYFYLDAGYRLGSSFTAYESRWFMKPVRGGEFSKSVPLPGAAEEISRLVSDITVVVRAEDYYTLAEPRVIDRVVEIPAKAKKAYAEMRLHKAAEINEGLRTRSVTVQAAAQARAKLLQIAAGFAYFRDDDEDPDLQQSVFLHSAKADAIESILEETGEHLVLAYQHKATLQILQRKFGARLRTLDTKGQAQDDWNAGKIELLAIQYASGSLGLSLQHGGRNIVLVEPTDDAEHYGQILERLGPMRQLQSGYNRTVNIFRLSAEGTIDGKVFSRTVGKVDTQDSFVDLLDDLMG